MNNIDEAINFLSLFNNGYLILSELIIINLPIGVNVGTKQANFIVNNHQLRNLF